MSAEQLLQEGKISAAWDALKQKVRSDPANPKHRVFLFQLLSVIGNWQKALDQLNVVSDLDRAKLPMVQTYREALACEKLRTEIFDGQRSPLILGEPEHWIALLLQSLATLASGNYSQAEELRQQAFELAPATSGTIDGQPFEWMADADPRLGPILEAIVNGRYYWIPFHRIQRIAIEAPSDLRDAVWLPANFLWSSGGETVGLIPTRYCGSEKHPEDAVKLSRKTDWIESSPNTVIGQGQRMLATDTGEFALMDVREIIFNTTDATTAAKDGKVEEYCYG